MRPWQTITILFSCTIYFMTGCASEQYVAPRISGPERSGLLLEQPVIGSVFDGRSVQEPENSAAILQGDLSRMYGDSVQWGDYFAKTPKGEVGVKIRIVSLGATFGSRLVSSVAYQNAWASAQGQASGPWGSVVASASSESSSIASGFSGEGWWNGATWIDVEIQDRRSGSATNFVVPIVAEHRESNLWGYASGRKAANVSWHRASEQLTRVLDMVIAIVRDEQ